jgi:hypothetical protein
LRVVWMQLTAQHSLMLKVQQAMLAVLLAWQQVAFARQMVRQQVQVRYSLVRVRLLGSCCAKLRYSLPPARHVWHTCFRPNTLHVWANSQVDFIHMFM